jgi:hypothetical protein
VNLLLRYSTLERDAFQFVPPVNKGCDLGSHRVPNLHKHGTLERNTFQRSSLMTTRAFKVRNRCSFGTSYVPARLTLRLIPTMNTRNSRDRRVPIYCRDQHAPSSSYSFAMMTIREWSPYSDICPCCLLQPTPIHLPMASVCLKFRSICAL